MTDTNVLTRFVTKVRVAENTLNYNIVKNVLRWYGEAAMWYHTFRMVVETLRVVSTDLSFVPHFESECRWNKSREALSGEFMIFLLLLTYSFKPAVSCNIACSFPGTKQICVFVFVWIELYAKTLKNATRIKHPSFEISNTLNSSLTNSCL